MSRTPPCTIAPTSPCRFPVCAEMPPMLDMLGTPWITSTSPGCARLCASNSAIRLTWRRAPSSGSMRWRMLRTVSAGPAMVLPGMVGRSTDAPMTPRRDAELVHGVRDDAGRIAQRDEPLDHALRRARYRHQLDVLGRDAAGQSFRLCNRHWSASRSSGFAVSRHFNLLPRGAQSRAPRTERYTDCAAGGGPIAVGPLALGERRSLPLPPFRHSGLHSHGIRTARH